MKLLYFHFQAPDDSNQVRLPVQVSFHQADMGRIGGNLVEGGVHGNPGP